MSSQRSDRGMPAAQAAIHGPAVAAIAAAVAEAAAAAGADDVPTLAQQQQPEGSSSTTLDPLDLVLAHLSSPDGDPQLYNTVARGLHRTSRRYHAEARATLRHLDLASYFEGLLSAYPDAATRPPAIPWDLVAACPGVTLWTLHQDQLACFTAGTAEQLAAAASKVKCLRVEKDKRRYCPASEAQLEGLGRLLWACRQLEEVDINLQARDWWPVDKPWLLLDPASTSLDTAVGPPLALRSWVSDGIPCECLTTWLQQQQQQQQQLGGTLQRVVMHNAGLELALDGFAALRRLRHLDVRHYSGRRPWSVYMSSPAVLSSISGLTALHVAGKMEAAELACQLTGLQDLRLGGGAVLPRLPSGIASLKQLTALDISNTGIRELPADLGVWLPRLERMVGKYTPLATVPATLTRLHT